MKLKLLLGLPLLAFLAHAQTTLSANPDPKPVLADPAGREANAYTLALATTAVPVALGIILGRSSNQVIAPVILVTGGALIGPSVGQFYLGSHGGGALGMTVRLGGGGIALAGAMEGLDDIFCDEDCDGNNGAGLMTLGLVVYGAGALWSLVDTHMTADRLRQRAAGLPVTFAPTLARGESGEWLPGAMASLKF